MWVTNRFLPLDLKPYRMHTKCGSYQEVTRLYSSDTLCPKLETRLRIPGVTNCLNRVLVFLIISIQTLEQQARIL